jgi:hypothetical protein
MPESRSPPRGSSPRTFYQGGYVDLYVDVPEVASGRLADSDAMVCWPVGARLGVAGSGADAVAFARAGG